MRELFKLGHQRWLTHFGLLMFTAAAIYATTLYVPYAGATYVLTIATGYGSLVLIVMTLSIGPLMLFKQRRNPVNINLRRDIGIWAAIYAVAHMLFSFTLRFNGDILAYFFRPDTLMLRTDRFGFANDLGLSAIIVVILLLLTSNDYSLRKLKGKCWKNLQRLNYVLAILAILHTLLFQNISHREIPFKSAVVLLTMFLLFVQTLGFWLHRTQTQRRIIRQELRV